MIKSTFLNTFRSICISLAILLVAGAIFVYSLNSARASDFPAQLSSSQIDGKLSPNSTTAVGKYMITYQLENDIKENKFYHFIIVWDSETGKSKIYTRDGINYVPSAAQLPTAPLE